jgi:arylsulfatase A-like enzyme
MPRFLRTVTGVLAALLALGPLRAGEVDRPNVLVILADDLGYSDLGCFGGEIPTPNIDRLAREGLRYTDCYDSARCCPSRASLLTGLHPHQAGIGSFAEPRPDPKRGPAYLGHLSDDCVTLAEAVKAAGYRTYMVGKWHMELPGPTERGFDEFYGFVKGYEQDQWSPDRYVRLPEGRSPEIQPEGLFYATDVFTDYALEFLAQARKGGGPWLLYLAHSAPHFPLQAPAESVEPFVATYRRGWDVLRAERFERMKALGLATGSWKLTERSIVPVDREDIANGYPGKPNPPWESLPEDRREDLARRMAIFAAMVSHLDRGVGRVVADLEAHGELENTLVFFLSDNGACYEWGPFGFDGPSREGKTVLHTDEALAAMGGPGTYHAYGSAWANLGNTPFRLYKHFCHEGGICTPLIVRWPAGIARRDAWVRDPVHVMDLMPTICDVAWARYPESRGGRRTQPLEGLSLVPTFRGEHLPERALAFEHQEARAIRRGRWKAVWSKRMPGEIRWELYDLETDRCETTDLAAREPERVRAMAEEWTAWARRVKVVPFHDPAAGPAGPGDKGK